MLIEPAELELATPTPVRPQVLIVDDEESIAEPLRLRLEKLGFGTIVARNGQQALDLARLVRPHCITLDLCLPDVDGLDLCQKLVDDEQTGEIPVIIVSGREQDDILRRARAAGCQYFVRKPYDPNVLLTLIRQAIDDANDD